ncbi:hypothetical protein MRX96_050448 [Rhipicephalus microplus]
MDHAIRELSEIPEKANVLTAQRTCQRCKEHRNTSQSPQEVQALSLEPDSTAHDQIYQDVPPACEVTVLQYLARALSPTSFMDATPECNRTDENVLSSDHQ